MCSRLGIILCVNICFVLAACAMSPPPFPHPTHSGNIVRAGHTVYIMKTNGDVVTFQVTHVARLGLQGTTKFVRNQDILKVVIVDYGGGKGKAATSAVVGAVKVAEIFSDIRKGIGAVPAGN